MSEEKEKSDYQIKEEAKIAHIVEYNFDKVTISLGSHGDLFGLGLFGGEINEAAVCLVCYAMVPIVDLTNAHTAVAMHAEFHKRIGG